MSINTCIIIKAVLIKIYSTPKLNKLLLFSIFSICETITGKHAKENVCSAQLSNLYSTCDLAVVKPTSQLLVIVPCAFCMLAGLYVYMLVCLYACRHILHEYLYMYYEYMHVLACVFIYVSMLVCLHVCLDVLVSEWIGGLKELQNFMKFSSILHNTSLIIYKQTVFIQSKFQ